MPNKAPLWVIQNNGIDRLTRNIAIALRQLDTPFIDISVHQAEGLDAHLQNRVKEEGLSLKNRPLFFYGSTLLVKALQHSEMFAEHLLNDIEKLQATQWVQHRGQDMLNSSIRHCTLKEIFDQGSDVFVRPISGLKSFAGARVQADQFEAWFEAAKHKNPILTLEEPVVCSPVQHIEAEYRFIVTRGKLVLASQYKSGDKLVTTTEIEGEVWDKAKELSKGWMPIEYGTMDLARLSTGEIKIVEFNGIHCCGIYAIDPKDFIGAVNLSLEERQWCRSY